MIMKKEYIKPSCRVYQLSSVHQLLSGSYRRNPDEQESDDWLNFAPGMDGKGKNKMA